LKIPFWSRRTKIIRVKEPLPNLTIFDVKTFSELKGISKTILESDRAYFAVDSETYCMYRLRKRNFKPSIRYVEKVSYLPDQNFVELDAKELLKLACDINSELLQTPDSLIMLTSGIVFISKLTKKSDN